MSRNIFIITAAHQYLYIYEAVKKFHNNENNILYFMNFQGKDEYLALKEILLDINWSIIVEIPLYKHQSLFYRYIQYRLLVRELKDIKVNALYISQYGPSYSYMILNSIKAKQKIITDDGQALVLFSKIRKEHLKMKKNNSLKLKLKQVLYKTFEPKQLTFFTTNNIDIIQPDKIIKNDLYYLRELFSTKDTEDTILFLGSPFVAKNMMTQDKYTKLLENIFKYYKNNKIRYYPHRAENIHELKIINDLFEDIDIVVSNIPIEFYLMTRMHPKKIISFYSGAVPNLMTLFKENITIDAVKIPKGFFISQRSLDIANSVYSKYTFLVTNNFKIINLNN